MKSVEIFVFRGRLYARLEGEEKSLGFLLSRIGQSADASLVHLPNFSKAMEADFKIVHGGFGLRISRFGRGKLELLYEGEVVEMVGVQVDFGKLGPIAAFKPEGVSQLRAENSAFEEATLMRKVRRKERRREKRQACKPIEEIPPGLDETRLFLNEKKVPMVGIAVSDGGSVKLQTAGLTKDLKRAANGDVVSVIVKGRRIAELKRNGSARTYELRGLDGMKILIGTDSGKAARLVLRENGRGQLIGLL